MGLTFDFVFDFQNLVFCVNARYRTKDAQRPPRINRRVEAREKIYSADQARRKIDRASRADRIRKSMLAGDLDLRSTNVSALPRCVGCRDRYVDRNRLDMLDVREQASVRERARFGDYRWATRWG